MGDIACKKYNIVPYNKLPVLSDAVRDFEYLIDRGYNLSSALKLVCDRYLLDSIEKNILQRAVLPIKLCENLRKKEVFSISGEYIIIDGYNVINTLYSARKSKAFISRDSVLRDFAGVYSKFRFNETIESVISEIIHHIDQEIPEKIRFIFDAQVSWSGELVKKIRKIFSKKAKNIDKRYLYLYTSRFTDRELRHYGSSAEGDKTWIVCSSDTGILKYVVHFYDLPRNIAGRYV